MNVDFDPIKNTRFRRFLPRFRVFFLCALGAGSVSLFDVVQFDEQPQSENLPIFDVGRLFMFIPHHTP